MTQLNAVFLRLRENGARRLERVSVESADIVRVPEAARPGGATPRPRQVRLGHAVPDTDLTANADSF